MKNRDLELLSAYLDGRLAPQESARFEARLRADPELEAALADMRATRSLLRKLPQRNARRNFTLTRKMVGVNPPLPRSYSFFRFATAFASLLLILTFAANVAVPRLSYVGPRNGGFGGGYGGEGIGGGPMIMQAAPEAAADSAAAAEAPATEAPALEAPAAAQAEAAEQPAGKMAPPVTATAEAGANMLAATGIEPTAAAPMEKSAATEAPVPQSQPPQAKSAPISAGWQIALLTIALIGAAATYVLRQSAKRKWQ